MIYRLKDNFDMRSIRLPAGAVVHPAPDEYAPARTETELTGREHVCVALEPDLMTRFACPADILEAIPCSQQ